MNWMWKRLSPTLFLILLLAPAGLAQFTQMQIPQPTGLVNDFAGKLSPATKESLENLLTNFKNRSGGIEITVVTIPFEQMNDYPIEDYALELGRQWGVGSGSDKAGLVLLVAIKPPATDGRYSGSTRLEVSRHLEGDLPDGLAGELIRRMRVDFQNGRFDQALTTGAQTILATLAEKRGISMEGIDSSAAYHPVQRRPAARRGISPGLVIIILIVVFLLFNAIRRGGGGGRGGHRRRNSDWWVGPVIWGGGGGGWGGNSSGGWGGGGDSGGGWGGFGGGGDFGGGGASDSW